MSAAINFHLGDCMKAMRSMRDKQYDLAIVDPPYGLGDKLLIGGKKGHLRFSTQYQSNGWRDVKPEQDYFEELFRISKKQIIWGGNYFDLPPYRCPIVWDKLQPVDNFSQIELAWSSFDKPAKIYKIRQAGFIGDRKIHPCQKPVSLYKSLLKDFGNIGDRILDTHGGSASIAIACYDMGFDLDLWEIDPVYIDESYKRYEQHISQLQLFQ